MAGRLGVTQAYVSMPEQGRRPVAAALRDKVANVYELGPAALAVSDDRSPLGSDAVAQSLAALGYRPLGYLRARRRLNPAEVLLRAGFVLTLARQVAERQQDAALEEQLRAREKALDASRLAREDTLCHESLTQAERRWLRAQRAPEAAHWNLLAGLRANHLRYAL